MLKNAIADGAMWDSVVTDHDAAEHLKLVARATVALAGTWPYLAAAESTEGFETRLALMSEGIANATPPEILDEVVASLRENFQTMHTAKLAERAMTRTAARTIEASEGVQSLPDAYVHVHKHGAGDDEYYQVDHVAGPTWLNTVAHTGDHDEAMTTARQYSAAAKIPLYENGHYVEGKKARELFQPDEEFWDAKTSSWVPVSSLPNTLATGISFRDGMPGMGNGWTADLQLNEEWRNGGWTPSVNQDVVSGARRVHAMAPHAVIADHPNGAQTYHEANSMDEAESHAQHMRNNGATNVAIVPNTGRGSGAGVHSAGLQATAHQSWSPGGSAVIVPSVEAHARMRSNWGDLAPVQGGKGMSDDDHVAAYHQWATQAGHNPDDLSTLKTYEKNVPGIGRARADKIADIYHGEPGTWRSDSRRTAAYAPDQDAAWRYHYPLTPGAPVAGGQPTAPNVGPGVSQPVNQTSVGPDGFPMDFAQGEGRSEEAYARQLTPGQWVAPPGGWPAGDQPNAATGLPEGARTAGYDRDALHAIQQRDPDAGERQPTQADYAAHKDWAVKTHGQEAWDRYKRSDWDLPDSYASRRTAGNPGLTALLTNMDNGEHRSVSTNNGHSYTIGYNSEQAMGDNNQPAKGYTVGAYDVTHDQSGRNLGHYRHTPHGPSLEGAKRYAAEQAADTIDRHARDQKGHHGSRRTATEGVVPTPGPNPNYFSQGTQGVEGPAQFPDNPSSAIEPKTDNHMDDIYGAVPPQVSSGSAENQTDGAGYSRMAYLVLHRHNQGVRARMFDGSQEFNVGHWPHAAAAKAPLEQYAAQYERTHRVRVAKKIAPGSGLGFSQGAGERTAAFHPASPTGLNEANHVHETNETDGFDSGFTPAKGGIHVHDYPRAISELQANWNIHDDNLADEWNPDKARESLRRREVGKLVDSLKSAHSKQAAYKYVKQQGDKWVITQKGTGKVLSHHDSQEEAEASFRAMMQSKHGVSTLPPESERKTCSTCKGQGDVGRDGEESTCPTCEGAGWLRKNAGLNEQGQFVAEDTNDHWQRGRYDASNGRQYAGEENQDDPKARAYREGWDHFHNGPSRTASTDGKIVGTCDHCKQPVRYHTERGGHLQHLHSGSRMCSDGKVATAMRVPWGPYEARFKLSAFIDAREAAVLENPTADNPTGKGGDPYRARTSWEGFEKQRPRQEMQGDGGMNPNTPTTAPDPIKQGPNANTPLPGTRLDDDGPRERSDDDEDDDDDD